MASEQPVHGGSAQTKEFDIDLLAAGVHWAGDPEAAEAVVSVDANATLRMEISAPDRADWQLDARALGGSFEIRVIEVGLNILNWVTISDELFVDQQHGGQRYR